MILKIQKNRVHLLKQKTLRHQRLIAISAGRNRAWFCCPLTTPRSFVFGTADANLTSKEQQHIVLKGASCVSGLTPLINQKKEAVWAPEASSLFHSIRESHPRPWCTGPPYHILRNDIAYPVDSFPLTPAFIHNISKIIINS